MIVASAIKHKGIIFTGFRHPDIIRYLVKLGYEKPIPNHGQGFIDHTGEFLSREEAKIHAFTCKQISTTISVVMTSEDLW